MTNRAPGMDHGLYPFSALPDRPRLVWPGAARVAVSVVLYLEHWELAPPANALRDPRFKDPFGDFAPDYRTYTTRQYGNRVGVFRVLETLDALGWPVTAAVNAAVCDRYPNLVDACLARGWEIAAHGGQATRMVSERLHVSEERRLIRACADRLCAATGVRPTGWIAQDFGESARTPGLLAEAGFRYLAHWPNDDQPYRMRTDPAILSIPCQVEWDDVHLLWHRRLPTPRYPAIVEEALTVLHAEGATSGRSFVIGVHPWLFGMPHRIRYLREALRRLSKLEGLWPATLGEQAAHLSDYPHMVV